MIGRLVIGRLALALACTAALVGCRSESWRTTPPAPPIEIQTALTPFEASPSVLVARVPDAGTVHLELVLRGGFASDPAHRAGLTRLAARALLEGTEGGDRRAQLDRFGDLGARPSVRVDDDGLSIAVQVRPQDAERAATLLGQTLARPTLDPDMFARARREAVESLRLLADDPNALALLALGHAVLDVAHPTDAQGLGIASSIEATTVEDVRARLDQLVDPARAVLVCVGDVALPEAERWAKLATAGWSRRRTELTGALPARPTGPRTSVVFVEIEGLSQAVIAVGGPLLPLDDPREPAQAIARDLAGGIVQHELRTVRQLSYGVLPMEVPTATGGVYGLSTKVDPAQTRAAIDAMFAAFGFVRKNGLGPEGIVQARRAQAVRTMVGAQSFDATAELAREAFERGAGPDAAEARLDRLIALRGSEIDEAFVRDFDPRRLALVVVGPPSAAAAFAPGDLGRVVRITPEALTGLDEGASRPPTDATPPPPAAVP